MRTKLESHVEPPSMESETRLTISKIQILRNGSSLSSVEPVSGPCLGPSTYHGAGEDSCLPPDICTRVVGVDFAHEASHHIDGVLEGDSLKTSLREGCW